MLGFKKLIRLLRYRFFLLAGILPYLLGQIIAFNKQKFLNWQNSGLGFLGIFLVLTGVEFFNEYFDAKEGGDRIFLKEKPKIPDYFFPLALCSMLFAFFIGVYLTFQAGWLILLFSLLGFLGAYFYVGPPIRWAYRGLGEVVISLCYGPFMVLGSYYLQTKRIDFIPFFISLICGLSIFCLALLNEIPDFYQDRLAGKRNLVVRLGKQKALRVLSLSLVSLFLLLAWGIIFDKIPLASIISFLFLPLIIRSLTKVWKNYENPRVFLSAINIHLFVYLVITFSLSIGYLGG